MIEFPPVAPGEEVVLSASTYVAYRQCPEQGAGRLRGEYGPDSPRAFVGNLSHRIFARHLRDGPIGEAGFGQACREEIGGGMNQKMASLGLRPSALAGLISETAALYERFQARSFAGFVAAEVELEAEPAGGVVLRGQVDAVFEDGGVVALVDWKTGRLPATVADQLDFYTLLWVLARGALPGRVEAISVQTGERGEAVATLAQAQHTAAEVAGVVDALRRAWAGGGGSPRVGGPWCRYCPQAATCPEGQAAVRVTASA